MGLFFIDDLLFLEISFFDLKCMLEGVFLLDDVGVGILVVVVFWVILVKSLFFELFWCSGFGVFGLLFVFFLRNFCFVVFVFKFVREVLVFIFFIVKVFFCLLLVFIGWFMCFSLLMEYLGDIEVVKLGWEYGWVGFFWVDVVVWGFLGLDEFCLFCWVFKSDFDMWVVLCFFLVCWRLGLLFEGFVIFEDFCGWVFGNNLLIVVLWLWVFLIKLLSEEI